MNRNFCLLAVSLSAFLAAASAVAMPVKSQMLKPRAYFQEADNNLLEALDLKSKTLKFSARDSEACGTKLQRQAATMTYSCTLEIPSKARISKLQSLKSQASLAVTFGGSKRQVETKIAADGKSVTFTTSFDATGIDFEVSKFNDDFFKVYDKVAQLVIADAQARQPVIFEVLESR